MKTLDTKEWVAVVVSIFVVGFFFIFGQTLVSLFIDKSESETNTMSASQVLIQDNIFGSGDTAQNGDRIVVHYTGHFVDGTIFDSSVERGEPIQFVLGSEQFIKGWNQGIVGMKVGGKRTITIPPEYGYGYMDNGPIPGGSTLVFEIELLKVEKQ